MSQRVLILTEDPDWHCRRLVAAFGRNGARAVLRSLREARFDITGGGPAIVFPGLDGGLPDRVLVRVIPAGSFEQVTARLSLLHAMRELGIRVINDARAIERCVDKSMTSFLLDRAGIPTPPTLITESVEAAAAWRAAQQGDVVSKPLFGAQGRGLRRLAPHEPLPDAAETDGIYYLQRYVGREAEWRDFRVLVVGDEPLAAMMRRGAGWVTNVARGGACEEVPCRGALAELAVAATRAVGADYAGVDLIESREGRLMVLEVNSMPAWKGLQSVTETPIADALASHVLRR